MPISHAQTATQPFPLPFAALIRHRLIKIVKSVPDARLIAAQQLTEPGGRAEFHRHL